MCAMSISVILRLFYSFNYRHKYVQTRRTRPNVIAIEKHRSSWFLTELWLCQFNIAQSEFVDTGSIVIVCPSIAPFIHAKFSGFWLSNQLANCQQSREVQHGRLAGQQPFVRRTWVRWPGAEAKHSNHDTDADIPVTSCSGRLPHVEFLAAIIEFTNQRRCHSEVSALRSIAIIRFSFSSSFFSFFYPF